MFLLFCFLAVELFCFVTFLFITVCDIVICYLYEITRCVYVVPK